MIVGLAVSILLFLPGVFVIECLSKKLKVSLSVLEKILFGSVFWFYLFIMVSLLIGLFSTAMNQWFVFFLIISSIVVFAIPPIWVIRRKTHRISFLRKEWKLKTAYGIVLIILGLAGFFLIVFHSLFIEWDPVYLYIPLSKGIALSGGIVTQPYHMLNFFAESPVLPIAYAWVVEYSSVFDLLFLPAIFFLLTLVALWLVSSLIFPRTIALLSTAVFASIPATLAMISARALYLDMAFLLFVLAALYAIIKFCTSIEPKRPIFLLAMSTMAITLMVLTRLEFGYLLFFILTAVVAILLKIRYWQFVSVLSIGLVYYVQQTRNVMLHPSLWVNYLQVLFPIFILSGLLFTIFLVANRRNQRVKSINFSNMSIMRKISRNRKLFLVILILALPCIAYLARDMFLNGFLTRGMAIGNPEIVQSSQLLAKIFPPRTSAVTYQLMNWQNLFSNWWLITPYLAPFLIGAASMLRTLVKKREISQTSLCLLAAFVGVFAIWTQIGCEVQPRRLYYMIPFIAIGATYGFYKLRKLYSFPAFVTRMLTYIVSITFVITLKYSLSSISLISRLYDGFYEPASDFVLLSTSLILFVAIFTPYERIVHSISRTPKIQKKTLYLTYSAIILANIIMFSATAAPVLSNVTTRGFQLQSEYISGWAYYPDVVNYYNSNINDTYTTVGFYCHELTTFANRTIVDLSDPVFGSPIYSVIQGYNDSQIYALFAKLNVGYILAPTQNNGYYTIYQNLKNQTAIGHVLASSHFQLIQSFQFANLYRYNPDVT